MKTRRLPAALSRLLRAQAAYQAARAGAPAALRLARRTLGLTQEEFARALGISNVHVSFLENGHKGPSMDLVRRLAALLDSRD